MKQVEFPADTKSYTMLRDDEDGNMCITFTFLLYLYS